MTHTGVVYLLHLSRPLPGGGLHYIGWASALYPRLAAHAAGRGAKMLGRARELGISWRLVRCWEDVTRHFERRLKRRHHHARLCPVCRRRALAAHAAQERIRRAASTRRVEL